LLLESELIEIFDTEPGFASHGCGGLSLCKKIKFEGPHLREADDFDETL
jgi:hypothetical protein